MRVHESVLGAIGRTPLVRLKRVTRGLPVAILAKVEHMNPGGSIKDRIGLAMIEDAERAASSRREGRSSRRPRETPASGSRWSPRSRAIAASS